MPPSRLLGNLDRSLARVSRLLVSRYGEQQAAALQQACRKEYAAVIPQIPDIGDRSPLLIFLLPATRHLAVYRTLARQGESVAEAGRLVLAMGRADLEAIPFPVRKAISYLWFSRWFRQRLKQRAVESQERRYPGGYVLAYVEGSGLDFDYGIDYHECAACKFLQAQDAAELMAYVCEVDRTASDLLGWGLRRTMTLAQGSERCDFRFKRGAKTDMPAQFADPLAGASRR